MTGGTYTAKHVRPEKAAARPRPRWTAPALATGVLLVAAGAVTYLPGAVAGPGDSGPPTTVPADGGALAGDALAVCTRASLEDRAALVLVVGLPGVTTADDPLVQRLARVGVGGVMLRDENILDEEQAVDLVNGLRAALGDHLLVAVDDEGGRVSSMAELDQEIASARRLGQREPRDVEDFGEALGDLAASVGVDWVLAPVADVDDGPASGVIGDRSFGGDPAEVTNSARAFARGLHDAGLAATAKHFPGHGGSGDPHLGATVDDTTLATLRAEDLPPFEALIDDGIEAVMVGHVAYPSVWGDRPASLEPGAYDLLRELGFDGVAVTDALGMGAVHARFGFDVAPAMAVSAGADAVLVNQGDQIDVLHDGLVGAVRDGWLDEARLDEAVRRMLELRDEPLDGIVCAPPDQRAR
ncbi:MAG: glycoside hydrolase family 3 N-terminal domain-containing protein [Acidimicrobiales bacterium]